MKVRFTLGSRFQSHLNADVLIWLLAVLAAASLALLAWFLSPAIW